MTGTEGDIARFHEFLLLSNGTSEIRTRERLCFSKEQPSILDFYLSIQEVGLPVLFRFPQEALDESSHS